MRLPSRRVEPHVPGEPKLKLDPAFWKRFAREDWDKRPRVLEQPFASGFPTEAELFEGLLQVSHGLRHGDPSCERSLRILMEHGGQGVPARSRFFASMVAQPYQLLPTEKDDSLDGWLGRVGEQLPGVRFGVVLNGCQRHVWNHWLQLKAVIDGLAGVVGMPLVGADSATFIGNYQYTPFGIHKDDLHVFNFVVRGRKTFCLWPLEDFAERPEVIKGPDLRDHRNANLAFSTPEEEDAVIARAQRLVGHPGDIMYWPASWWHVATPSEGFTINVSLGVHFRPPFAIPGLRPAPLPARLSARELPGARGTAWKLPAAIRQALPARPSEKALREAQQAAVEGWLRLLTGAGFVDGPPLSTGAPALDGTEWVRIHPERPLVTTSPGGDRLTLACNGRARTLPLPAPARRRLERLVASLEGGVPRAVSALEATFFKGLPPGRFKRADLRALLEELVSWRALSRVPAPEGAVARTAEGGPRRAAQKPIRP